MSETERTKQKVVASIYAAQDELNLALDELQRMPSDQAENVRYTAHALNNYLTVISACIDLLSGGLGDDADVDAPDWVRAIQQTTLRMKSAVHELQSFAAPQAAPLHWESVDLSKLVGRACRFYHTAATNKAIQLEFDTDDQPISVWADRIAVGVVLDNLLSNAVKYSDPGTKIDVSVHGESEHGVCTVRDHGPGLSAEQIGRLFRGGVTLGHIPTGGESSSGYGLAIAKDTLDRLSGSIDCESAPGKGAAFTFRLPRRAG